jgi:hypothetical protein
MSINVPTWYAHQYSTNIDLLLQQKGSRFRNAVMMGGHVGDQASPVDQIGAVEAQKVVSRFAAMSRVDASLDRRWVFPTSYDLPQLIDSFDKLQILTNPEGQYVTNAIYGLGRKLDDEIIAAFFGTAKTGTNGGTDTSYDTSMTVDDAFGGSSSGLTVKKLIEARRLLRANEVDLDNEQLFVAITSKQEAGLLNDIQIVSKDYNERPVLVDGRLMSYVGFNFIHSERLGLDSTAAFRAVPFWAKSGMYLGVWGDVRTSISKRNDLQSEPWQAYAFMTVGATRLEEGKVGQIECLES